MPIEGFTAGVQPGGLYRKADIQLLLCYMLHAAGEPMPRAIAMDIVVGNGMANYFETTEALESLIQVGSVRQEGEEQTLSLTESGVRAAQTLTDGLPRALRERSATLALHALARRRHERETQVTSAPLPHGCAVTCTIPDGEAPLMSLTLKVADQAQADFIRERFVDDPDLLYRSILSILTGRARVDRDTARTTITVI